MGRCLRHSAPTDPTWQDLPSCAPAARAAPRPAEARCPEEREFAGARALQATGTETGSGAVMLADSHQRRTRQPGSSPDPRPSVFGAMLGRAHRMRGSAMANDRFVGIALILLGVLFLLPRVSSVELPLDQWWPLFLAIAGLATALNGNLWGGLIAIAVAAAFLVDNLGIVRLDASSLWPLALIAIGAAIIFGYWRVGTGDGLNVASLFSP